jgi:nitroreductase
VEFERVVRRRRMVRNFEPREVPEDVCERIVANALRGPSAGFSQGVELLVCREPDERARFWAVVSPNQGFAARGWPGVYNAGLLITPFAHRDAYLERYAEADKGWADRAASRWPVPFWYVDAGFAALLALLTAVDAELGALFFGIRDHAALREAFGVPASHDPIGAIAIGYPAPDRPSRSLERGRRPLEDVVHRGRW